MLTVGSLFAGIGGLDLGLEWAGMQVKWQVEIDRYCNRVLAKHWPQVKRYGNIKSIDWSEVEPVDLISGGFPCQPVSVAGARKGDKDERWLWPEFLRAIREVRPKYALMENVPGLLSIDDGRLARGVFGDLAEIGYDAEWGIVSARDVGAPHRRQRILILAYPKSSRPSRGFRLSRDAPIFGRIWGAYGKGVLDDYAETDLAYPKGGDGQDIPDSKCKGFISQRQSEARQVARYSGFEQQWAVEPDVGRVANGVPSRVDRLKCLGNAVVPQVAEYIGKLIIQAEESQGGEVGA